MRIIKPISENEMIAVFLEAEIDSPRFGIGITKLLKRDNLDRKIIDSPNFGNNKENDYRRKLFNNYRGYPNKKLFTGFPKDLQWQTVILEKSDYPKIKYIDYSYWNELSEGSRSVFDGAKSIVKGLIIFDQPHDRFWDIARKIKNREKLPKPILVTESVSSELVILEGHLRLTSYFLDTSYIPEKLPAIVGFSKKIKNWTCY